MSFNREISLRHRLKEMMINKPFRIKAVLFDFDGTLTKPGALNFSLLKETIGCPADLPVLEFIESLPVPEHRKEACHEGAPQLDQGPEIGP